MSKFEGQSLPATARAALAELGIDPGHTRVELLARTWNAETWSLHGPRLDGVLKVRPFDLAAAIASDPDPRLRSLARIFPLPPFFCPLEDLLTPMRAALGAKIPHVLAEGRLADGARFTLLSRIEGRRLPPGWQQDLAHKRRASQRLGELLAQLHAANVPANLTLSTERWLDVVDETMHCVADGLVRTDRRPHARRHALHARFAAVVERLRRQPLGRVVINHGDFHPDNMLFSADGEVAGIVDFDIAGVGPAALDLRHLASLDELAFADAYGLPRAQLDASCWVAHALDLLWHGLALLGQHRFGGQPATASAWARAVAHVDYLLALCESDRLRRGSPWRRRLAERIRRGQAAWRTAGTARIATPDRRLSARRVAIVVVAYNHFATTTGPCLASLRRYTDVPYRVICIDNRSEDGTAAALDELARGDPRLEVVHLPENRGWATGSLVGLARLRPEDTHVVLLNSDTLVTPGWLAKLLEHHEQQPAPNVVTPVEQPPRPRMRAVRAEPAIRPGSGQLPGAAPAADLLLRDADTVEARHRGRCALGTPSGFCLLFARRSQPVVEEYLRDFASFHTGARSWHAWWQAQGTRGVSALDCYVFHARGGSGGYYAYDRVARGG